MTDFKQNALKELSDQARFAPLARRQEQMARAERLLNEIDSARVYPYQFVCFRLTDYRSDAHPDLLTSGADLKHDLALFVARVERSLPPLPIELAAEPMLTLEEVSKQFNVSTKTVSRWRMQGLIARRVIRSGRKHLGFPQSSVETFAAGHRDQVERGARFSHLTDAEKDEIVISARRLAAAGNTLTEVSKTIAGKLSRSAEAVRYTIKNFDRAHPDHAVFPNSNGPLDAVSKQLIFTAFQEGKPVQLIAKRFGRTPSSMYRVINEVRAERLVREPVDYIYNAEFDDPVRSDLILGSMPHEEDFFSKVKSMRPPKDVEAHMAYLYERPLLSREQEAHVFRKMNYLKHKLHQFKQGIDPARARVQDLQTIEDLQNQIKDVRDLLIECNQRLVHNLATKHLQPGQNLDELKSDANVSLMRAVEKFDYGRGFKFSTYATWAIMKNFARSIPDENTQRSRYMTGTDELFESRADVRTDEQEVLAAADAARARVNRLLQYLDPRTREVIKMRTGLDGSEEMTLEQIGQHFGITKERVRQINVRGMKQLRERAAQENVELP
ncbi:sigma-70 family RNA polymerase sigma factor [Fimbriiglobus ruber]|uniref:RNA polymerase sigma factor RpoD n=1 Tax=Fimbriiglobus ruber TaxID=1908690 RepID=A0A225D4A0_9BACT|nr:sigma-70 family RNA polymerase sigma factor [Fimbriiglobus ruber]OWK34464.1 RNA polymerase sigma factor RpoD [Fimbriiglobus ruber]